MKKITSIFIIFSCLTAILSCSYNKEELPEPVDETDTINNPVIPTVAITYTSHAKAIIDNKCVVCHSVGGTGQVPFLDTYSAVESQSNRILARAINASGGPMPPSGLITPQATRDTLEMWLDQGALE